MIAHWNALLLSSAAILAPVCATYGHVKVHDAAIVKRKQEDASKRRWEELQKDYLASQQSTLEPNGKCTWDNMVVRKEW
jgi:hypothetical protein